MASIVLPRVQDGHGCPVKESGTFGPLTHRQALPILVLEQEGFHFTDFPPPAPSVRRQDPNGFITSHR